MLKHMRTKRNIYNMINDKSEKSREGTLTNTSQEHFKQKIENLNFLKKMTVKYKFCEKTFYLGCLYFEIITNTIFYFKNKNEFKLDLITISCLLLSSKFNENDPYIPNLRELQGISYHYYNAKEIIKYEELSIKLLQYKLDPVLAYDFLLIFFKIGIVLITENDKLNELAEIVYRQSLSILSDYVYDERFFDFSQFHIACACAALSRELSNLTRWNEILEIVLEVSEKEFTNCFEIVKKRNRNLIPKTRKSNMSLSGMNSLRVSVNSNKYTPVLTCPNTCKNNKTKSFKFFTNTINEDPQIRIQTKLSVNKILLKRDSIQSIKEILSKPNEQVAKFLKKRNITLLMDKQKDKKVEERKLNRKMPDVVTLIKSYSSSSKLNNTTTNTNKSLNLSSRINIPSLTKIISLKKYHDSQTLNSNRNKEKNDLNSNLMTIDEISYKLNNKPKRDIDDALSKEKRFIKQSTMGNLMYKKENLLINNLTSSYNTNELCRIKKINNIQDSSILKRLNVYKKCLNIDMKNISKLDTINKFISLSTKNSNNIMKK